MYRSSPPNLSVHLYCIIYRDASAGRRSPREGVRDEGSLCARPPVWRRRVGDAPRLSRSCRRRRSSTAGSWATRCLRSCSARLSARSVSTAALVQRRRPRGQDARGASASAPRGRDAVRARSHSLLDASVLGSGRSAGARFETRHDQPALVQGAGIVGFTVRAGDGNRTRTVSLGS